MSLIILCYLSLGCIHLECYYSIMHPDIVVKLITLNRQFYQTFGEAFSATRQRIQPGVNRILEKIPDYSACLDLGCGNGTLALEWAKRGLRGMYYGIDYSFALLGDVQVSILKADAGELAIRFARADLTKPDWTSILDEAAQLDDKVPGLWDGILCFATLHHIPSETLRIKLMRQVRMLIKDDGKFYHSEWQFQHSKKLMERRLSWDTLGIRESDLDDGDTLLDWRHALPEQEEKVGLRYVHLFDREELTRLAMETGFKIIDEFESDGQGGKLALYQTWMAV